METLPFDPPAKDYAGYIFDLDGTLADTMPVHYRSWVKALREAGATFSFPYDFYRTLGGMGIKETVALLNAKHGTHIDPAAVAVAKERLYWAHTDEIAPIPAVVAFAASVAGRAPVAVASGGGRKTVANTLSALGLADLFPVVVTHDDVRRGKPDPEMFLRAAELMGVPAAGCVVFEDSPLGLQGARDAGMDWVLVDVERARPPEPEPAF